MGAVLTVAAVVFVAELGDKSQLLALSFATRYPARSVLAGLLIAAGVMHAVAVVLGTVVASVLPERAVTVTAGVLFLVFAALTLPSEDHDRDGRPVRRSGRSAVPTVAVSFLAAEFGDKTMLASTTLAATHGALGTWVGATTGMFGASALAVAVGGHLATRLRPRLLRLGGAAAFMVVGVALLAGAVRG